MQASPEITLAPFSPHATQEADIKALWCLHGIEFCTSAHAPYSADLALADQIACPLARYSPRG